MTCEEFRAVIYREAKPTRSECAHMCIHSKDCDNCNDYLSSIAISFVATCDKASWDAAAEHAASMHQFAFQDPEAF